MQLMKAEGGLQEHLRDSMLQAGKKLKGTYSHPTKSINPTPLVNPTPLIQTLDRGSFKSVNNDPAEFRGSRVVPPVRCKEDALRWRVSFSC